MRRLLNSLLGRKTPSLEPPQVIALPLEDAILQYGGSNNPVLRASLLKYGSRNPAGNFIELAMPLNVYDTLRQLGDHVPQRMTSIIDYALPDKAGTKDSHYRYIVSLERGDKKTGDLLTVSHQVGCATIEASHPDDPSVTYSKPEFMTTSQLTGLIRDDVAHVAICNLVHPYGAVDTRPAALETLDKYRQTRDLALANQCDPLPITPPRLPSLEERVRACQEMAARSAKITDYVIKELLTRNPAVGASHRP